jgi:hypothetical protein
MVVLPGCRERKSHLFFLSMYLYPLLNYGRFCSDVGYSYPSILLGYSLIGSLMFPPSTDRFNSFFLAGFYILPF